MIKIAVLLTCFNRKEKTISCLRTLFDVLEKYQQTQQDKSKLSVAVFLTDDGSTDGTSDSVRDEFAGKNINIIKGTGSLYWAGGMRLAWNAALEDSVNWDYFLLLNDDTDLLSNLFEELFVTCEYGYNKYGIRGVVSGIISAKNDPSKITYGGDITVNKLTAARKRVYPNGEPIMVDFTNANILLIHASVVKKIGIFYKGFRHAHADFDYTNHARKAGIPVLLTGNVCGRCDDDHGTYEDYREKILSMSLRQRVIFFTNPASDYLCYIRRNAPFRYPFVAIGRFLNIYFPSIYYALFSKR